MKKIYKSPESIEMLPKGFETIFLAGSIEMDRAVNWQKICEEKLSEKYLIFNPRRDAWDASWVQTIENPKFKEQVEWELNALEKADKIIMFFAANTQSPISLLEFGLYAKSKKMYVVVENDFYRKGNIDIVCQKYNINQYDSLEELFDKI